MSLESLANIPVKTEDRVLPLSKKQSETTSEITNEKKTFSPMIQAPRRKNLTGKTHKNH